MPDIVICGPFSELPQGTCRAVEIEGRQLALFNVGGQVYCLENVCIHRGGPLGEGTLEGDIVTCPWHGWQFNVRNGSSLLDRNAKVPAYPVEIEGDIIKVTV